jgi:hypothetical protein
MKTTLATFLLVAVMALTDIAAGIFFMQSDAELFWRLLKDWGLFIASIAALLFAAYRGRSYTELKDLVNTREKKISDQAAEIVKKDAKIERLEERLEEMRSINLRLQGDEDHVHRSKSN